MVYMPQYVTSVSKIHFNTFPPPPSSCRLAGRVPTTILSSPAVRVSSVQISWYYFWILDIVLLIKGLGAASSERDVATWWWWFSHLPLSFGLCNYDSVGSLLSLIIFTWHFQLMSLFSSGAFYAVKLCDASVCLPPLPITHILFLIYKLRVAVVLLTLGERISFFYFLRHSV
jgi:hypothetical protein